MLEIEDGDYPPPLAALVIGLDGEIIVVMDALEKGDITLDEWKAQMEGALAKYTTAAYMAGQDDGALGRAEMQAVAAALADQLAFLDRFTLDIKRGGDFWEGWKARAEQYAKSIVAPYWKGATKILPLPAMPAQGTLCKNHCKCKWRVVTIDEAAGDYDAYWARHAKDSCATCLTRAELWNPIRIRGGVLEG